MAIIKGVKGLRVSRLFEAKNIKGIYYNILILLIKRGLRVSRIASKENLTPLIKRGRYAIR